MKRIIPKFALLAAATSAACFGAPIAGANSCPQAAATGGNTAYENAVAASGTCNQVITVSATGQGTIATANPNPYDGTDDNLIGVVNNSGVPITVIHLSSTSSPAIFDLDNDGICGFTPFLSNSQPCNSSATGAQNYAGTATSYTNIAGDKNSGDVNFAGTAAIAGGGGTGYFSLESPPGAVVVSFPILLSKAFTPGSIVAPGNATLTFTVRNLNSITATGIAFSDTFPTTPAPGIVGATTATNTCGGTVTATSAGISLSGGTLGAGLSCTITENVSVPTAGTFVNTTSTITSTGLPTGGTATATLAASVPAPGFSKAFSPATVAPGGTTTLTFTISNNDGVTVTGLAFSDPLPSGVTVASTPTVTNTCGGTVTATAGSGTISLSGGSVAAPLGTVCKISVNVTGTTEGIKNNTTSTLTSTNAPSMSPATATLTVISPATITKSFGEVSIVPNGTVSLTFNISNPNTTLGLTGVGVTDVLPAGLLVNNPSGATTTCTGATVTAVPGSNTATLSGGTLAAGASCTVTLFVQAGAGELGLLTNVSGPVISNAGPGGTATASVFVGDPFQVTYIPNLNLGDSVINITNSGARGAGLNSGTTASVTGALCANVYAFSPDEQLVSCCSCPVTPNGLVSLSARTDLVSNTLTPNPPTSLVVKILATVPNGGSCTNSATAVGTLALSPGLTPFGTKVHAGGTTGAGGEGGGGGTGVSITETPFTPADLSSGELSRIGNLCNYILANGSGFGICRSCRLGGLGADSQ